MLSRSYNPDYHPADVTEHEAVSLAYRTEIEQAATFLRLDLAVLVICDKLIVDHLATEICAEARLDAEWLRVPEGDDAGPLGRTLRQRQLADLKQLIRRLNVGSVLVIPHLDLLAGGTTNELTTESRELIELVYEPRGPDGPADPVVLAFADRSLDLPEVLQARFAVRMAIAGLPGEVRNPTGQTFFLGEALMTREEAARIQGFNPADLYKNVAGMNPIRLRHAVKYAVNQKPRRLAGDDAADAITMQDVREGRLPAPDFYRSLQAFKAQRSEGFQIPDVTFEMIGGFEDVKVKLRQALDLLLGRVAAIPVKLQGELIPRGFMFYGPPGTGKTLFAKAIAHEINATIQVVSGPEVTNMYVGESERRVRELFAEARKNAPSVLVFEEFDSIAQKRSGRDDGGSRAGNALVAQILTEMDGFRPDVPILVIGTTNQPQIIDKVLLRPTRFEPVHIGLPDRDARRQIAEIHAKHFQIELQPELLDVLADSSKGFNGDEIRSVFRDACVGRHLEGKEPNARRLGELVGLLRRRNAQVRASESQDQPPTSRPAPPQRREQGDGMARQGDDDWMIRQEDSAQPRGAE